MPSYITEATIRAEQDAQLDSCSVDEAELLSLLTGMLDSDDANDYDA